jgi:hypothetical protein
MARQSVVEAGSGCGHQVPKRVRVVPDEPARKMRVINESEPLGHGGQIGDFDAEVLTYPCVPAKAGCACMPHLCMLRELPPCGGPGWVSNG